MRGLAMVLLAIPFFTWLHSVANRNDAREEALLAFDSARYVQAIPHLTFLRDSLEDPDSLGYIQLAIGHAYFSAGQYTMDSLTALLPLLDTGNNRQKIQLQTALLEIQKQQQAGVLGGLSTLDSAFQAYRPVLDLASGIVASQAYNQSGYLLSVGFVEERFEDALAMYKRALKENPENAEARYNYEMLKKYLLRKEQEEQEEGESPEPPEPSDYAKQLKEQADALVAQRKYNEALQLLVDGMQQDPSVAAYQGFMSRIQVISEIDNQ
ncbi:MAG TPA: hypothetical protein DCE41_31490 [Cytophagales bacterium]|nr:hypothetical protein [Cytophagales bacterium]HAA19002.1 hypothetical protein [Cytophagales bacterium]HAP61821.1 hypothetical protein [Cytophagales bacterium]